MDNRDYELIAAGCLKAYQATRTRDEFKTKVWTWQQHPGMDTQTMELVWHVLDHVHDVMEVKEIKK